MYRGFADLAWSKLRDTGWFQEEDPEFNHAPAKGFPPGSIVNIEVRSLAPLASQKNVPIKYARLALLETIVAPTKNGTTIAGIQTLGIQVLNLVIFPLDSSFPVWGSDFVSLPGGKNLLLLDAQPMHDQCQSYKEWDYWYQSQVVTSKSFPWGGDFPAAVQRYVSPHALWTRMTNNVANNSTMEDPLSRIQNKLPTIFEQHLDIYLDLLKRQDSVFTKCSDTWIREYLSYRLENDPARPMLKSLYGEEWTERVLRERLFPLERLQ